MMWDACCSKRAVLLGLVLAAGLTRLSTLLPQALPDASLAAFFLAGLYLRQARAFGVLLAVVVGSDWLALNGGVDSSCISAGYGVLVASYYLVWRAGVWAGTLPVREGRHPLRDTALALSASIAAAFVVSNLGYYVFSDAARSLSPAGYAAAVVSYFPAYAGAALCYVAAVLLIERIAARYRSDREGLAPARTR